MKVLVISERYWPDGGGGELATHLIVDILRDEFKVAVVTGTRNSYRLPGVEFVYEPLLSKWEKPVLWFNTSRLVRAERFRKLIRECDVIYIPRFAFPIIPYAKQMGKKVIVHLHDYIPVSYTAIVLAPYEKHKYSLTRNDISLECRKSVKRCLGVGLLWWLPRLARKWIAQADKVICVSKRQAEIISDLAPELKDKIEVIYNPIPPELLSYEPRKELDDKPAFLYVGGDSYVKGFHVLLQALKEMGKQGVKARFILANKYSPKNLELLKRLSEKHRNLEIQVMGRVKYEELLKIHKKTWALVFPSIWEETFGYAILEAALLGTIPMASRVGGVVEIIDNTTASAYMFTPGKVSELVKKLEYVCSLSSSEVKSLGRRLREEVFEKFNPSKLEEEVLRVFAEVVGQPA